MYKILKKAQNIMEFHAMRCPLNIPTNFSGSEEHLAEYRKIYQKKIPEILKLNEINYYNEGSMNNGE